MSYRIEYAHRQKKRVKFKSVHKRILLLAMILIISIAAVRFTNIQEQFHSLLLPGDPQVTEAALSQMIRYLRNGADFREAVTVFCQEVLDGAALQCQ